MQILECAAIPAVPKILFTRSEALHIVESSGFPGAETDMHRHAHAHAHKHGQEQGHGHRYGNAHGHRHDHAHGHAHGHGHKQFRVAPIRYCYRVCST
jgi:hypothetical protein